MNRSRLLHLLTLPFIAPLTLTVDLTRFRGRVEAVWFHPTTGNSAPVPGAPFANSGPQDFLSSGEERNARL
jgi:hypothetical protein